MLAFKNLQHPYRQISKTLKIPICWVLGLLIVLSLSTPSQAHWDDLVVADIQIRQQDVDINLTVPTGLLSQFDDNKDRQLSDSEITRHQIDIQKFINDKIQLTASQQKSETLIVQSTVAKKLPSNLIATPDTHSNLLLKYHWPQPVEQLQIHYDLFVPGVNTARCLVQICSTPSLIKLVICCASGALIKAPFLVSGVKTRLST